jgi:catechol 2,3-dioxygenase-like lactoylglutathione lyase family enzyme
MSTQLAMTTLVVDDYDRGIVFARDALGLALIADSDLGEGKRWVVLGGAGGGRLLIAVASDAAQQAATGRQAGGRVAFFLETDDFATVHARLVQHGIPFHEAPRHESYGTVAVFEDPWGNRWDLIEPARAG